MKQVQKQLCLVVLSKEAKKQESHLIRHMETVFILLTIVALCQSMDQQRYGIVVFSPVVLKMVGMIHLKIRQTHMQSLRLMAQPLAVENMQ